MKMKMKIYDKKHPMRSSLMIASGVALIVAGSWMSMRMMHHSKNMYEEQESC